MDEAEDDEEDVVVAATADSVARPDAPRCCWNEPAEARLPDEATLPMPEAKDAATRAVVAMRSDSASEAADDDDDAIASVDAFADCCCCMRDGCTPGEGEPQLLPVLCPKKSALASAP